MPAAAPASRAFDLRRYESLWPALHDALRAYRSNPFLVLTDRDRVLERV